MQIGSSLHSWGGIERYIAYLIQGLAARGHRLELTCPPNSPLAQKSAAPWFGISNRRTFNPVAYGRYVCLFQKGRYDIVHSHFSPDFLTVGLAARRVSGTKAIMTRHVALPWKPAKARLYAALYDRIIPVSEASYRALESSGIPAEKMQVAKAGCPPLEPTRSASDVRQELCIDHETFAVGIFGRLAPEKGPGIALDAAAKLTCRARVLFFGDGPMYEEVLRRCEDRPAQALGFKPNVANWMGGMDAVAIPSVWEEAFPFAALEAMSIGKPVIASDVGGIPEIVEHGVTGLLVAPNDPGALAAAIDELASDPNTARRMGDRGRSVHRANYTVPKMAERIERVYLSARQ